MLKNVIKLVFFLLAVVSVIKGSTIAGYGGLGIMFIGVGIILGELYLYNKQYT